MKKQTKELNQKTIEELQNEVRILRAEIAKLRLYYRVNQEKNTNIIPMKRKKLAAVLTVLSEKTEEAVLKKVKEGN